jgi:hypothetical protein
MKDKYEFTFTQSLTDIADHLAKVIEETNYNSKDYECPRFVGNKKRILNELESKLHINGYTGHLTDLGLYDSQVVDTSEESV